MIKALFLDVDGTLLNDQKLISPQTRAALERCKADGVRLFIATGRPPLFDKMLSWDRETCALFDGGVFYNGGCVIIDGKKEYVPVTSEIIRDVVKIAEGYGGLNVCLQMQDEVHAFRFPIEGKDYQAWGVTGEKVLTLDQARNIPTVKIMLFYEDLLHSVTKLDDALVCAVRDACAGKAQFYLTDRGKLFLIMGKAVNKMSGVEKVRKEFGYAKDEIAVFGDDANDVVMLAAYPYSFAMGNAEEYVKKAARFVTLDNNHDGVCHAVYKILRIGIG